MGATARPIYADDEDFCQRSLRCQIVNKSELRLSTSYTVDLAKRR